MEVSCVESLILVLQKETPGYSSRCTEFKTGELLIFFRLSSHGEGPAAGVALWMTNMIFFYVLVILPVVITFV